VHMDSGAAKNKKAPESKNEQGKTYKKTRREIAPRKRGSREGALKGEGPVRELQQKNQMGGNQGANKTNKELPKDKGVGGGVGCGQKKRE